MWVVVRRVVSRVVVLVRWVFRWFRWRVVRLRRVGGVGGEGRDILGDFGGWVRSRCWKGGAWMMALRCCCCCDCRCRRCRC